MDGGTQLDHKHGHNLLPSNLSSEANQLIVSSQSANVTVWEGESERGMIRGGWLEWWSKLAYLGSYTDSHRMDEQQSNSAVLEDFG